MKVLKSLVITLCVYTGIVITFEMLIGVFQPADESTLVITTRDAGGAPHDCVLTRLESDGKLYVAANHWPRRWYRQALENPAVEVALDGERGAYRAVPG